MDSIFNHEIESIERCVSTGENLLNTPFDSSGNFDLDVGNQKSEIHAGIGADLFVPGGTEMKPNGADGCGDNEMKLADWRWAAQKGFWDPLRRRWNDETGGLASYLSQRNRRRLAKQLKSISANSNPRVPIPRTPSTYAEERSPSDTESYGGYPPLPQPKRRAVSAGYQTAVAACYQTRAVPIPKPDGPHGGFGPSVLLSFMERQSWAHAVVRRHWSMGYQPGARMVHDMPCHIILYTHVIYSIQHCIW
jgi:hypothetical protein